MTKILWVVIVHGYMEESDVKSTCVDLGKLFLFEIYRVVKFSIQNLTRCKKVGSKSDKMKCFYFKIMLFRKKIFLKIMLFIKNIFFKIVLLKIHFFFKFVLFKYARKTQNLRILRGKLKQNVIFCVQFFFQNRAF